MIRLYARGYSNEDLNELIAAITYAAACADSPIVVRDLSRVAYYASTLLIGKDDDPDAASDEGNSETIEE